MTDAFERVCAALSDRYTIERELGSGGMATVYLAEDLKHHRKVAVKVLRPELAAALGADRFNQEIEIAAQAGLVSEALSELEPLLASPSSMSIHMLQLDPRWDPIREDPRFQELLERYGTSGQ